MAKYPGLVCDNRRHWTVRVRVPDHLQAIVGKIVAERAGPDAGRKVAPKRELWRSTGTSDKAEANKKFPLIRADLDALLLEARRRWEPARKVTEAELHQLVRAWFYRWNREADAALKPMDQWERLEALDRLDQTEADALQTIEEPGVQQIATRFIEENGLAIERGSREWFKTVQLIQTVDLELTRRERARVNGAAVERHADPLFAGITAAGPAPELPRKFVTLSELFEVWAGERRFAAKTRYSWKRVIAKLEKHLGHNDVGQVNDLDIIAWKDALVLSGLAPKTIANHLTIIKTFLRWAAKNKRIRHNPAAEIEYKPKRDLNEKRLSYTDEDARAILLAARKEPAAHKRWVPWLAAFTGARLDELCGAMAADVRVQDGITVIRIDPANREKGGSVKNQSSIRDVPLHPAIIAEGFVQYVEELPKGSVLFPALTPDRFGKRGGNGTKTIGRWVREKVGITDKRKAPSHSWRHRFADLCRKVDVPREIRFALDGHAGNAVGDRYGSDGYPIKVLAEAIAKLPSPV